MLPISKKDVILQPEKGHDSPRGRNKSRVWTQKSRVYGKSI